MLERLFDLASENFVIAVFGIVLAVILISLGITQLFYTLTYKECTEGFFWSYREMACLPGYKP